MVRVWSRRSWFAVFGILWASPVHAQLPGGDEAVIIGGVVKDAVTGAGVAGAYVRVGELGPTAIADSIGTFRIVGVPAGANRITAQRFGYVDLLLEITVSDPQPPLELMMQADPLVMAGVTVMGGARVVLLGRVRASDTGAPVPWALVSLSPDAVREAASSAADASGVFRLPDVTTGGYLLRVERLGYESVYVPIDVTAPPEPVDVQLRPDSMLMAGIAAFEGNRSARRRASPFTVRAFDERELRLSRAHGMRRFLEQYTFLFTCNAERDLCLTVRGRSTTAQVYIDELFAYGGMPQLDSYTPEDLYSIEVFQCSRGVIIRAYTYAFIERVGRRSMALFPGCGFGE